MTPIKTFLCLLSIFAILGLVSFLFPVEGVNIGFTTLRFPSLSEVFPTEHESSLEANKESPEDAVKRMLSETEKREFAAYADSLAYYENFFKEGATRFDLPDDDPTWFDKFFLNLEIASLGEGVVHIIHYGDSQLEEDRISSKIREDLQELFGGAGPGMLPPVSTIPAMTVSHSSSGDMERKAIFADTSLHAKHNRYGPLAQMAELNGGGYISIKKRKSKSKTRANDFSHIEGFQDVRLLAGRESKSFKARLTYEATIVGEDSVPKTQKFNADAPTVEHYDKLNVYRWKLPHKASGAALRVSGRAELYALSADGESGVAVDNVAMRGSSGTVFHKMDGTLLKSSYEAMNVKLLILQYGGNLVPGMKAENEAWARKIISRQIKTLQNLYPEADIVFIGPADMCKRVNGKLQSYPGLERTIRLLKELAAEYGLAYWDMHRVMGGNESMISWVKQTPALGFSDYVHFTRAGAAHMGDLFSSSLRMYYDYFKFREAHDLNDKKLEKIQAYSDSVERDSGEVKNGEETGAGKTEAKADSVKADAATASEAHAQEQAAPEAK